MHLPVNNPFITQPYSPPVAFTQLPDKVKMHPGSQSILTKNISSGTTKTDVVAMRILMRMFRGVVVIFLMVVAVLGKARNNHKKEKYDAQYKS
jgi:hypothetical protein